MVKMGKNVPVEYLQEQGGRSVSLKVRADVHKRLRLLAARRDTNISYEASRLVVLGLDMAEAEATDD